MSNEEILKQYRNYVKKVLDTTLSDELNNEGKDLLERDFENKVINLYGDLFNKETWSYEENIVNDIKNHDKIKFIKDIYYEGTEQKDFILNNWDKLDVIINILFSHYIATEEPKVESEKKITSKETLEE